MVNHHPRTGDRITSAQLQHGREHARPTAPELFLFTGKKRYWNRDRADAVQGTPQARARYRAKNYYVRQWAKVL